MKKKNFRKLTAAPDTVKCISCGIITARSETKDRHWYVISGTKDLYCCPNCDVTIIEKQK